MSNYISDDNVKGHCINGCRYIPNYTDMKKFTINKTDDSLILKYDSLNNTKPPTAKFNDTLFTAVSLIIKYPPCHQYNNDAIIAELFITHVPNNNGPNLLICVPIKEGTGNSIVSMLIDEALSTTNKTILKTVNLNQIIPPSKYYYYESYPPSGVSINKLNNIIVFGQEDAVNISQETYQQLKNNVKQSNCIVDSEMNLTKSLNGINTSHLSENKIEDAIFDCEPISGLKDNSSDFKLKNENTKLEQNIDLSYLNIILGIAILWSIKTISSKLFNS